MFSKQHLKLDQRWVVDLGADRTPHISQAQSINVFLPADVHKKDLHQFHFQAWKKGLKVFIIAGQNQFREQKM